MKIAFIVQPDWLEIHFGVRNLFVSCFKILEQYGHKTDFIHFEQHFNKILFYKHIIDNDDLKSNIKITTIGTKKKYSKLTEKKGYDKLNTYTQFLGDNIYDDYDAFIITNPWLVTFPLNLKNKPVSIICYDCVANSLGITENSCDYGWGYMHNMGYKWGKQNHYYFLSISNKTDKEIVNYYTPKKHSYLPPVPTYAFLDVAYNKNQVKENAIILAAPFDKRKGLDKIPTILNKLESKFDTLYIYGTPRCGKKLYKNFYKKLKIKNIIHYNEITSNDLIELYKKCKILLFPSIEEGLGIPIIEAQLCGCRVVTTDKSPMNTLLCKGNYLLTDNIETDISNIINMLNDKNFDYYKLSIQAQKKFSTKEIYNKLLESIK
ncbi:MAG: glycosyltransferase [Alphaproteobacteria bacterium]